MFWHKFIEKASECEGFSKPTCSVSMGPSLWLLLSLPGGQVPGGLEVAGGCLESSPEPSLRLLGLRLILSRWDIA